MYNIFFFLLLNFILLTICKIKEEEKYIINKNDFMSNKSMYIFEKYYINRNKNNIIKKRVLENKEAKNSILEKRNLKTFSDAISNDITYRNSNINSDTSSNIHSNFSDSSTYIFSDSFSMIISDSNKINFSDTNENNNSDITLFDTVQNNSNIEDKLTELITPPSTNKGNEIEIISTTTPKEVPRIVPPNLKNLTNILFLVQIYINSNNDLELYIVVDSNTPFNVFFIVTMNYYLLYNNNKNEYKTIKVNTYFTYEIEQNQKVSGNKERLMCYTSAIDDDVFHKLVADNYGRIKFVVTHLQRDYVDYSILDNNYVFVTYYLQNTGSDKKDIYNYTGSNIKVRMYKIKTISTSTDECQFNLTLNKRFEGRDMKLILEFKNNYTENNITRRISNKAECLFTYEAGKNVVCKLDPEMEGIELEYLCSGYIYNDKNEIYTVYLEAKNATNFLVCKVAPPYYKYIFVSAYFVSIVATIFVALFLLN